MMKSGPAAVVVFQPARVKGDGDDSVRLFNRRALGVKLNRSTDMSTTKPEDTRFHNQHAAAIYRAIARRFYEHYVEMRHAAKLYGGDVVEHAQLQQLAEAEAENSYLAAVEYCIWEGPDSAVAALAMAKFAGVLAADRLIGEILQTRSTTTVTHSTNRSRSTHWVSGLPR